MSARPPLLDKVWTIQRLGLPALAFLNFFPPAHGPTRYLFFSLLILAIITLWRQGQSVWVRTPLDVPLLLFVGWILFTIPFSIDPAYSFREWRKLSAQVLVFYWSMAVLKADTERRSSHDVLVAVLAGTAVTAGYAIIGVLQRPDPWSRDLRAGAIGSDYNWLSTYMVMALPLTLTATMRFRAGWLKVCGVTTTGLALVAEVAAYTRAGWIGLVAEACVGLWLAGRRWLLLIVLVILASTVAGVALTVTVNEQAGTSAVADPWTFKARLNVWKLAATDLFEHPLVGVGYGNYNFVKRYSGHPELEKAYGPHSTFIVVGLGSGLPALACFLWLIAKIYLVLTQPIRQDQLPTEIAHRMIPFGVALMVIGVATRNLFDYMLIGALANLFWIMVALGLHMSGWHEGRCSGAVRPATEILPASTNSRHRSEGSIASA